MSSRLGSIPTYALAALCVASAVVRITTIYNATRTNVASRIDVPAFAGSLILFPASSMEVSSILAATAIDFVSALLVVYSRTRFFASGTVLVLLGMSAGGTMGTTPWSPMMKVDVPGSSSSDRTFEIAIFKLMVANVATLSAWRDSRITSRVVDGVRGKAQGAPKQNEKTAMATPTAKVNVVPGVHQKLR